MKNWLQAQPVQPATIADLQALLDAFTTVYNQQRPHTSLPARATPAVTYTARPKTTPTRDRDTDSHDRVRTDRIDTAGKITLRHGGTLYSIGLGRTTPEPACSPSSTTYTSASSTPPPANSCAN